MRERESRLLTFAIKPLGSRQSESVRCVNGNVGKVGGYALCKEMGDGVGSHSTKVS